MANPIETWKAEKHSFDVWPDVEHHSAEQTPMSKIESADLERMKWYGFFYRKRDEPGRYMNRIRITAGEMTAEQAREIAFIAYEYGHGIVDVTTRANVQVQGLDIQHVPKVRQRLEKVGLNSKQTGHDNIRNVFAHPFSGLMADELIDTRQLCHDVTDLFVNSREYSDLPRKMNICLNGTSSHSAHFWTQDISFLATQTPEGEALFHVLIGGTQGQNPHLAWHLPVLVRPEQVVDVTAAILDLFREKGSREKRNRARFRFLVEEIGVGGVLQWLEEKLPYRLVPCVGEPVPASSHDELIGWFRQSDPDLWTMGLSVPLGRMTWKQLEGLALLAKRWGDGQLRTTHEQGIAVANIPTGFRDAAATAAAALGLSVQADTFDHNTVACTGNQFCNIAVTETKGHMFQLIQKLRQRALTLHGIRIHMSGCPSSCAQHFTADIGLKGVRVRRLLGTREGFDVFLGGGIAGQVHMALPFRLGVDVDQLPNLIEEVINDYYLHHQAGQTFSAYWREKLRSSEASKAEDDDYKPPVWLCERCGHQHTGEDPPVFCPSCAAIRRNFARLEEGVIPTQPEPETPDVPTRSDGFVFAAKDDALSESAGLTVEVGGDEYALFRVGDKVTCIDSACPHEGAPLADGEYKDGVVACPWHNWTFDACSGCSLDPPENDVKSYETLVEDGNIFIRTGKAAPAATPATPKRPAAVKPVLATLTVAEVIEETPDVKTFRLDNSAGAMPFDFPGKHAKICVQTDEGEVWRSFTISSPPSRPDRIDLTMKLNPAGVVTNHLFQNVQAGDTITLKGAQGGYFFDPDKHAEPLVLISAGSGVTPMMAISRYLKETGNPLPCTFLYGARSPVDIIFRDECEALVRELPSFRYFVTLSQPGDNWTGAVGRLSLDHVREQVSDLAGCRYFLCGPNDFMNSIKAGLLEAGVVADRIHTEQFHKTKPVTV
ncbi:Sulfite reductase [ferredoxin] [Maioricimonas rarisocia]|uniref:Sulfite reductase [ferredoxin] n=1 Tax=Maioricimonas rarisocia TaxID=2528026 RepID=A0A517Z3B6_9PLAN|nr:Rieske 2Fe-2S domain-containing protein [Maioricimonas rarisocia]QDU36990.1 Sulfite reductase [ferredoxin] [Maioricimonas rarisocia]